MSLFPRQRLLAALRNSQICDDRGEEARLLFTLITNLRLIGEGSLVRHFFPFGTALYVGEVSGQNYYILLGKCKGKEFVAKVTTQMP